MLKSVVVKDFAAVPYLETSALMVHHKGTVKFSTKKPNVIAGPNGAGKSALLNALSLRFLTHFHSRSALDRHYLSVDEKGFWAEGRDHKTWEKFHEFLPGLKVATDGAPAMYYRPSHMPGNEPTIAHAMMMGYDKQARAFGMATRGKSSGQQSQALQEELLAALQGQGLPEDYLEVNWSGGRKPRTIDRSVFGDNDSKVNALLKLTEVRKGAVPLLMMDEPEQSLDALAEMNLWKHIAAADCSKMQIIVATHSLYPFMHLEDFHFIEAVPGYTEKITSLIR